MSTGVSAGRRSWRTIPGTRRLSRKQAGLLLVAFVISLGVGYQLYQRSLGAAGAPAATTTVPVRTGSLVSTVTTTGSVVVTRLAKLGFGADGKLVELNVAVGDRVKSGQPLARQDTAPLKSKLTSAESSLKVAQFNLEKLKAGATSDELEAARLAYQLAVVKYDETAAGPTEADLLSAQSAVDQATAGLASAEAKLADLKAGATQVDLAAAQAKVETARSALTTAQEKLKDLKAGPTASELAAAQVSVEQAKGSLISTEDDVLKARDGDLTAKSVSAYEQAYNSAKASYETAVKKLQELQEGPTAAEIEAAQSAVTSAQASYDSAVADLDELKRGATSIDLASAESAVHQARASLTTAQTKLKELQEGPKESDLISARSALVSAKIQLDGKTTVKESDLVQMEEQVRQAEAAVDDARLKLDSATITAPFDGIVSAIGANVGEQVGSGSTVITVVDPMAFRIDVAVDESDVAKLAVGQAAAISFDALPDQRLQGKVISVAPTGTTQQGVVTYPVSIGVENPGRGFPGGMSASISIETERKDNVLLVPNRAVRTQGRNKVVEVMAGEKTEIRPVQVGSSNDQMTEIVSGLAEGDQVVISATTIRPTSSGPGGPGGMGGGGVVIRRGG